jgi:hypothetical protein
MAINLVSLVMQFLTHCLGARCRRLMQQRFESNEQ